MNKIIRTTCADIPIWTCYFFVDKKHLIDKELSGQCHHNHLPVLKHQCLITSPIITRNEQTNGKELRLLSPLN